MRIAIFGANSQIASDLITALLRTENVALSLFVRQPDVLRSWLQGRDPFNNAEVADYTDFGVGNTYDCIMNFVGVGDPAKAAAMGPLILDLTQTYDELALSYIRQHPSCRYLFLSSGAAYGSQFSQPVSRTSHARFAINDLQPQDWYGVSKAYAECRHRAHSSLAITDIRVFNYFSRTQNLNARFLMSDILRAILHKKILNTSADVAWRDFLHPSDFFHLIQALLKAAPINTSIDCYTQAPIDKVTLLDTMRDNFGLRYAIADANAVINATGNKSHYYSCNKSAAEFGYRPAMTSKQGLLRETRAILFPHLQSVYEQPD
jgi:nucleoside-diphosphate-sugar epimerase